MLERQAEVIPSLFHLTSILPLAVQRMYGLDRGDPATGFFQALSDRLNRIETLSDFFALPPQEPVGPWGFDRPIVDRFPALKKRNFFVVQEHSVRLELMKPMKK